MSSWIGKIDSQRQPKNAVTVMLVFGIVILCTILPSQVAFTSLTSAGGIPTTAAYGLIALLRLTMTPNDFKGSHFFLGKWRKPFYIAAVLFNGLVFAVRAWHYEQCSTFPNISLCSQTQISPFYFPVTPAYFNFVSRLDNALYPMHFSHNCLGMCHLWCSDDLRNPQLVLHPGGKVAAPRPDLTRHRSYRGAARCWYFLRRVLRRY